MFRIILREMFRIKFRIKLYYVLLVLTKYSNAHNFENIQISSVNPLKELSSLASNENNNTIIIMQFLRKALARRKKKFPEKDKDLNDYDQQCPSPHDSAAFQIETEKPTSTTTSTTRKEEEPTSTTTTKDNESSSKSKVEQSSSSSSSGAAKNVEEQPSSTTMVQSIAIQSHVVKSAGLADLADEKMSVNEAKAAKFRTFYRTQTSTTSGQPPSSNHTGNTAGNNDKPVDALTIIRNNLPQDPLLSTPFGNRRTTYADYTASGRSLRFLEEYIQRVVAPLYANTHTETSATGLQTTHFREEARSIILQSLGADPEQYSLIFTGTGSTGAIWKLIAMLGIHCPVQLQPHLKFDSDKDDDQTKQEKVLVLISHCEHHSNELMWRETVADVMPIPNDETGSLDLTFLRTILEHHHKHYQTIIGSFTAGSNVTGLTTKPEPVADLMHEFGGYACFDYAGAGPYKDMKMTLTKDDQGTPTTYLDAIYISPHKFVGGPGTPGLLCVRKDFANCRNCLDAPPTIAGGGTVTMVWPSDVDATADSNRTYESILHVREEAGTPGIVESIRCGMAFYIRGLVGPHTIEELEGRYAKTAVERMHAKQVWVMGDTFSGIHSSDRLSITSFNVWAKIPGLQHVIENGGDNVPRGTLINPVNGKPLMLHAHFVAALLNDVYGIQARSGCACAGPLSFRLFGDRFPFMTRKAIDELVDLAEKEFHSLKPAFCRVNFNYFIDEQEFDYILSAIEQIAEHGWKLLPLYALCLKTGQYWYNGLVQDEKGKYTSFNRFDAVRRIKEIEFQSDGAVTWNECRHSNENRHQYLDEALQIYDSAPQLVRQMLFRYRDFRKRDMKFPERLDEYRFFALGSEVLPHLGISDEELQTSRAPAMAADNEQNPMILAYPKHPTANPWFTMDRPRG